jgi:hypothetical protein
MKPTAPSDSAFATARKNHDRGLGVAGAGLLQGGEAVTVRQPEIEQQERKIRMLREQPRGFAPARRLQDGGGVIELAQDAAHGLAN